MTIRARVDQVCRATLMALILCAFLTAAARAELIGTTSYSVSTVSDGQRLVAFQPDDRHVTVFDTAPGGAAASTYLIPESCAPRGYAFVRALGGGQLLVECRSPTTGVRPLLLALATGVWSEVPLLASSAAQAATSSFGAVGAHWLERLTDADAQTEWVNWHTSETRTSSPDERRVPDPDRADLFVEPCSGVHPASSPYVYDAPFAVAQRPSGGLWLQRCGSPRPLPIDASATKVYGLRLTDRIATWTTWEPGASAGAYLIDCHVSLRWGQPSGGTIVHAGRTLVRTFVPDKYGNPAGVVRLRLPAGCPRSSAARTLRVGQAGHRPTAVRPDVSRWRTSDAWGAAQARIEHGTFRPGRVVLQRGATLAVDATRASSVRWSTGGVGWQRARREDGRWTVHFGHVVPRRLRLTLRLEDSGKAEYRVNLRVSGS